MLPALKICNIDTDHTTRSLKGCTVLLYSRRGMLVHERIVRVLMATTDERGNEKLLVFHRSHRCVDISINGFDTGH